MVGKRPEVCKWLAFGLFVYFFAGFFQNLALVTTSRKQWKKMQTTAGIKRSSGTPWDLYIENLIKCTTVSKEWTGYKC